ncbi:MAG: redox-sensing transcriptional repressor Rex [Chloroflexi bacterium]|nr:MAG: redox-sensing transcriptional repressor Rex [Chloroflexota bacterium]
MAASTVPDIVIGRLPLYLRALTMMSEAGQEYTSSHELGQQLGIGSAQIRKDLSHFGEFGKQGTGYEVNFLKEQLAKILKVDRDWPVALVGFGDLGQAIAHYGGFAAKGFHIQAIFDNDPAKIGQEVNGKQVQDIARLSEIIRQQQIKIAIIAVPAFAAQAVADQLVEAGVKAILNYAPITLKVPEGVRVQYIDPVVHLQWMAYYLE